MVPGTRMSQPPNGISIGSAVFAQLISVTDTVSDTETTLRVTFVAIGRIDVMHAMQPINNNTA